jgi:hypothetical protein
MNISRLSDRIVISLHVHKPDWIGWDWRKANCF